jgi:hypothetical protein
VIVACTILVPEPTRRLAKVLFLLILKLLWSLSCLTPEKQDS